VHGREQVGVHSIGVYRVLQPGGEDGDRLVGVVAGAIEPAVRRALNSFPERVEQGRDGQGGSLTSGRYDE
jgi:hypothetical protein